MPTSLPPLLTVAMLITFVSYRLMISPPGGYWTWKDDIAYNNASSTVTATMGNSIMATNQPWMFFGFALLDGIFFYTSLIIIFIYTSSCIDIIVSSSIPSPPFHFIFGVIYSCLAVMFALTLTQIVPWGIGLLTLYFALVAVSSALLSSFILRSLRTPDDD